MLRYLKCIFVFFGFAFCVFDARADGDDFFTFRSSTFNADGKPNAAKNGFVGSVKDDDGNYLHDATLTIAVNVDVEGNPQRVLYNSYTNVIGRYRTYDAGGVVADLLGVNVEIKSGDVEMIGVEKKGYVQLRRIDRGRVGQTGVRDVDFIMKKVQ